MGLTPRRARRHTAGVQSETWWDFHPGQRVMTREGVAGVVDAVEDGLHPGSETYLVTLDGGLGGGSYGSSDLAPIEEFTARMARIAMTPQEFADGVMGRYLLLDEVRELGRQAIEADPELAALVEADDARRQAELHTADQDYPELGDILVQRPDHPLAVPVTSSQVVLSEGVPVTLSTKAQATLSGLEAPSRYTDMTASQLREARAKAMAFLEVQRIENNFEMGMRAVQVITAIDALLKQRGGVSVAAARQAGVGDWMLDKVNDYMEEHIGPPDPGGGSWSYDWCRFRKNRRCMFPSHLDVEATEEAGYPVWVPMDRGLCPRDKWADQKVCPVSEPGPKSGEPNAMVDATESWQEGGQRRSSLQVEGWSWKSTGEEVTPEEMAQLLIDAGKLTPEGAESALGDKMERLKLRDKARDLLYDMWGSGLLDLRTPERVHKTYPQPDPEIVEWLTRGQVASLVRQAQLLEADPADPEAGQRHVAEVFEEGEFTHVGLAIKAVDSGRVLLCQRTPFSEDPEGVYGRWEFPGGGVHDGEGALEAASREFHEETGLHVPDTFRIAGCLESGKYLLVVGLVPNEAWTVEANLLDFEVMGIGWFHPDQIEGADLAREEMDSTEWDMIREAKTAGRFECSGSGLDPVARVEELEDGFGMARLNNTRWLVAPGEGVCPVCQERKWLLKSGRLPKHTRYLTWKQQGEMGLRPTSGIGHEARFCLTAAWSDVRAKAKRIRTQGRVRIIAATEGHITGEVRGDHGVYQTTILRQPGKRAVASWECGCDWSAYSWGRSGRWKRFEGRMCSHALALTFQAQSDEMFGGRINVQPNKAPWQVDPTIPVVQPANYPKPKKRSSIAAQEPGPESGQDEDEDDWPKAVERAGWGRDPDEDEDEDEDWPAAVERAGWGRQGAARLGSNLHEARTDSDLFHPPIAHVAAAMLSEGESPNGVLAYLRSWGKPDLIATAYKIAKAKGFKAKVQGWVRTVIEVLTETGKVLLDNGAEVPARQVFYPTYDPRLGLDLKDSAPRISSRTAVVLPMEIDRLADALYQRAVAAERQISLDVRGIAKAEGGDLEGWGFRIKTKDSILDKLQRMKAKGQSPDQMALMGDTVRYTISFPTEEWGARVQEALYRFQEKGYRIITEENSWVPGDSYSGFNLNLESPDGLFIEVQFHTPQSYLLKEHDLHDLYKEFRRPTTPKPRRQRLWDLMTQMYDALPLPTNALDFRGPTGLDPYKLYPRPAKLARHAPAAPEGWDGAAPEPCDHFVADPDAPGSCQNCWWGRGAHATQAGGPTGHGGFGPYTGAHFEAAYKGRDDGGFGWYAIAPDEDIEDHPLPHVIEPMLTYLDVGGNHYRIASAPHDDYAVASVREGDGWYKIIGKLTWFGGQARYDGSNIDGGVIHEVVVDPAHRRRGIATAMLEWARKQHPDRDIRHSNALTDDGKAWSQAVGVLAYSIENGGEWHNSDGFSPEASEEELAAHLITDHPGVPSERDRLPSDADELDQLHAEDHDENGECGAHEGSREAAQGQDHPLLSVLQAVWTANAQTNARARTSAERKAYRLLAESGWSGYEGEHLSLHHYAQMLDAEVWGEDHLEAELHEEPEPALPTTDGASDDEDATHHAARRPTTNRTPSKARRKCENCGQILTWWAKPGEGKPGWRHINTGSAQCEDGRRTTSVAVDEDLRPTWLAPGDSGAGRVAASRAANADIAQMAQRFLKEGVAAFSPAEQAEIISEGEADGVAASNLDRLDIAGTHYELLEAQLREVEAEEEDSLWL